MKIFISHAKKDNVFVKPIVELFDEYEVVNWVDLKQLDLGDKIGEINKGLETSNIFLLIWSENAKNSEWVEHEKNAAMEFPEDKLKKITFRIDKTRLGVPYSSFIYDSIDKDNLETKIKSFIRKYCAFRSQLSHLENKSVTITKIS